MTENERKTMIILADKLEMEINRLKQLSSVQPEIIRCKKCIHNNDCEIQYSAQAGDEFYCGYAERRTDG